MASNSSKLSCTLEDFDFDIVASEFSVFTVLLPFPDALAVKCDFGLEVLTDLVGAIAIDGILEGVAVVAVAIGAIGRFG